MLPGALVGNDDEFDFVAVLKGVLVLDLARVEEELLALLDLVAQEAEGTYN